MRVLSRASEKSADRDMWKHRIRDVFVDRTQPDRLHAIECLAKLKYAVQPTELDVFEEAAELGQRRGDFEGHRGNVRGIDKQAEAQHLPGFHMAA